MLKNKIKYLIFSSSVGLFSLIFASMTTSTAHASGINLYWCNTGSSNFSTASNWNTNADCTSGTQQIPVSGDSLIFDDTNLTADATLNNNLTGLDIYSIDFKGTSISNYSFLITGNAISLDNGIIDTSLSIANEMSLDITLTADQSINDTSGAFNLVGGNVGLTNTFNIGNHNLTLNSNTNYGGNIFILSQLEGTGNIIMNGDTSGHYYFIAPANGYSGKITLDNGQAFVYGNSLGTGKITVKSGATLNINFDNLSPTFNNPLEISGNGFDGTSGSMVVNDGCPSPISGGSCTNTGTDTFSGAITLTGDTIVSTGGNTLKFTNIVPCSGFIITINVIPVVLPGTHPAVSSCSTPSGGGSTTSSSAPKTPNTGSSLINANKYLVYLGILSILSTGLYILSRKYKKAYEKNRR
ncbi:MAG: hypothetical protein WCI37_03150 [bacterium]